MAGTKEIVRRIESLRAAGKPVPEELWFEFWDARSRQQGTTEPPPSYAAPPEPHRDPPRKNWRPGQPRMSEDAAAAARSKGRTGRRDPVVPEHGRKEASPWGGNSAGRVYKPGKGADEQLIREAAREKNLPVEEFMVWIYETLGEEVYLEHGDRLLTKYRDFLEQERTGNA